jgi:4'-phosphopantetheinyl transferase
MVYGRFAARFRRFKTIIQHFVRMGGMPEADAVLFSWWATPAAARHYRRDSLRPEDMARALAARSPRAERDWQVSRAVLTEALLAWPQGADPALSLAHSQGHAVVALAPTGWRVGVDLESMRPRDFAALARWCCTAEEQAALAACDAASRPRVFYLLWTLKEAFIKAAGLRFPADMRAVGLLPSGELPSGELPWEPGGWRLRAPAGSWHAYAAVLDGGWMVSVVSCAPREATGRAGMAGTSAAGASHPAAAPPGTPPHDPAVPAWRAGPQAALPRVEAAWRWS